MSGEIQYLELLEETLAIGERKENRTGTDTLALPPKMIQHDCRKGFPLLTTKSIAKKMMMNELLGFIHGITEKKWYTDRRCTIWNEWSNPQVLNTIIENIVCREPNDKDGIIYSLRTIDNYHVGNYTAQLDVDSIIETAEALVEAGKDLTWAAAFKKAIQQDIVDLGPIYGYQWRRFDAPYNEMVTDVGQIVAPSTVERAVEVGDQLAAIIHTLKVDPNNRRLHCSAWNPKQLNIMALPPCHTSFTLQHINGVLHLSWHQRSCDEFLGVNKCA